MLDLLDMLFCLYYIGMFYNRNWDGEYFGVCEIAHSVVA